MIKNKLKSSLVKSAPSQGDYFHPLPGRIYLDPRETDGFDKYKPIIKKNKKKSTWFY
jgi:hypothetical protein